MILTPYNSTNKDHWGKEVVYREGKAYFIAIELPNEFDFLNSFFPKDPVGARKYYAYKS